MKNAASIQKNSEMEMKVHGMYGSTANEVDRVFRRRVRSARPLSGAGSAGYRRHGQRYESRKGQAGSIGETAPPADACPPVLPVQDR